MGKPTWVEEYSPAVQGNLASVKTTVTMISALSSQVFAQYTNPTPEEITEVMDRLRTLSTGLSADCDSLLYSSEINPEKRFVDVDETDQPTAVMEAVGKTGSLQEDYRHHE